MQLSTLLHRGIFLSVLLAVFSVILVGCDSGGGDSSNGGSDLNTNDAKTQLQNVDTDFATEVNGLTGGEFALTLQGLFSSSSGSATFSKSTQPLGFTLIDALDTQDIVGSSNDRLIFSTGEYNWNSSSQAWTQSASSSNLVLNFPTSQGINNNATFTLSTYQDLSVTIEGDTEYLPRTIDASLVVDGTEIFSVDLSGTDFYTETLNTSSGATQLPRQFMLDILTAPVRHSFDYMSPSKREFDLDVELTQASTQQRILRVLVGLTFAQNFDAASGAQDVQTVEGEFGFGPDVVLAYTVDVAGIDNLGPTPTAQEINNQFTATMQYRGRKMGTIEWGSITLNGQPVETALFVYNDGTKDPLATVFENTLLTANSSTGMVTNALKAATGTMKAAVAKVFQP